MICLLIGGRSEAKSAGFGSHNDIYIHPDNPSLVVRIRRVKKEIDIDEVNKFAKYSVEPISISPGVLGWGKTNNGYPFIIVERMEGFPLDEVKRFKNRENLNKEELDHMRSLLKTLIINKIILEDCRPANWFIGNKFEDKIVKGWLLDVWRVQQNKWYYKRKKIAKYYKDKMKGGLHKEYWKELDPDGYLINFLNQVIASSSVMTLEEKTVSSGIKNAKDEMLNTNDYSLTKGGIDLQDTEVDMQASSSALMFDIPPETIRAWKNGRGVRFDILRLEKLGDLNSFIPLSSSEKN